MSPIIYRGAVIDIQRMTFKPDGLLGPEYSLKLSFEPHQLPLLVEGVYLSDIALEAFAGGRVTSIRTEMLAENGVAASLLGGAQVLVTDLWLTNGIHIDTVPQRLRRWKFGGLFVAGLASLAAAYPLLRGTAPVFAAAVLLAASH